MSNTTVKSPTAKSSKATNGSRRSKEDDEYVEAAAAATEPVLGSIANPANEDYSKNGTMLIIARHDAGFDAELVAKAIKSIKDSPHRNVYLRVAHKSTPEKSYIKFTNEMFGGESDESYNEIIEEVLNYDGNDVMSFSLPMGYLNIHVNPLTKKYHTKLRTNLNGEVRYLRKHGLTALAPPTGDHPYVEEVAASAASSDVTLHKSNAIFLSKHSIFTVEKPTPAEASANPNDRLTYENRKFVELLYALQKNADTTKMNLDWLREDDKQTELVYVIQLDPCKIRIHPKETKPNSFERLKVMFLAVQNFLRNLNAKQINISNTLQETTDGKVKPVGFKWAFLPPEKDDGGRVVISEPVGPRRCIITPDVFRDRLRGFWGYKPTDDEVFDAMKTLLDVYGHELDASQITFPVREASATTSASQPAAAAAASSSTTTTSQPARPVQQTKQFFAKTQYTGRGRGYGRGNE